MENNEYNRLIINNKLDELASIYNTSDLTRYKYLKKYLLEYLLEQKIHKKIMDSYAITKPLWIKLYLKYNILEPLLNAPLERLFVLDKDELLLETLLKKIDDKGKIKLYQNLKKNSYWLLRIYETQIINLYAKYGIKIDRTFVSIPIISDKKMKTSTKLQGILNEFIKSFSDIDKTILEIYLNEFKKKYQINKERTFADIYKLIAFKRKYPSFKLTLYVFDDIHNNNGEYNPSENKIYVNWYRHGTFNHELSHMLYDTYEQKISKETNKQYRLIQKNINKAKTIKKIINYLKDFHERYDYMNNIFTELYYAEIKKKYGSYEKYYNKVCLDLKNNKPDYIVLSESGTSVFMNEDCINETAEELLYDECMKYTSILLTNYYTEELMLENLLDALLKGNIFEEKYDVKCLSGHSREYFLDEKDLSLDEVLANYDAIKNSNRAGVLINKLRNIVGNELVDFLDTYIENNRNMEFKLLRKK